ncbi:hypothetical protein [Leptolyngbya sp. CCY15150]|uniref:hypothetical protein n=1 Tax=Leptolyngbya sp. CCY15150 TaxID=2767772 RepID=UPI001951DA7C|nr:hypothetical protein [Leptolyngbya sp. CCY15150]
MTQLSPPSSRQEPNTVLRTEESLGSDRFPHNTKGDRWVILNLTQHLSCRSNL